MRVSGAGEPVCPHLLDFLLLRKDGGRFQPTVALEGLSRPLLLLLILHSPSEVGGIFPWPLSPLSVGGSVPWGLSPDSENERSRPWPPCPVWGFLEIPREPIPSRFSP